MKLVIATAPVKAYINNVGQPFRVVEKLSDRTSGKIGLFTRDSSAGDFKTIKINYKE